MVGGAPTFWGLFILIFRNIYYNMFHLSRESCGFYIDFTSYFDIL